ncbi:hypothetical protein ABW20_dc0104790 [Dactylellina cionopaga]|nr:hypothetical protein ABW20_dc0104790 [Dactylellina cionopaga]
MASSTDLRQDTTGNAQTSPTTTTSNNATQAAASRYENDDTASIYTVLPLYESLPTQPPPFTERDATTRIATTTTTHVSAQPDADADADADQEAHHTALQKMKTKLKELKEESETRRRSRCTLTSEEAGRMTRREKIKFGWYDAYKSGFS